MWSGNTTITNCKQTRDILRKSHTTILRHQEDKQSKSTSFHFPIKMIAKLEWTQSNAQQNIEKLQNPTMEVTINNETNQHPSKKESNTRGIIFWNSPVISRNTYLLWVQQFSAIFSNKIFNIFWKCEFKIKILVNFYDTATSNILLPFTRARFCKWWFDIWKICNWMIWMNFVWLNDLKRPW